jgi:uncharacterized cupin superfamily protein
MLLFSRITSTYIALLVSLTVDNVGAFQGISFQNRPQLAIVVLPPSGVRRRCPSTAGATSSMTSSKTSTTLLKQSSVNYLDSLSSPGSSDSDGGASTGSNFPGPPVVASPPPPSPPTTTSETAIRASPTHTNNEDNTSFPTSSYASPLSSSSSAGAAVVFHHAPLSYFKINKLTPKGPRNGADVGTPHDSTRCLVESVETSVPGNDISAGSWWCAAGGWPSLKQRTTTEVFYVLEGYGCLTDIDGVRHYFGPGDVCILPKGWSGRWDIAEDIHKVCCITTSSVVNTIMIHYFVISIQLKSSLVFVDR